MTFQFFFLCKRTILNNLLRKWYLLIALNCLSTLRYCQKNDDIYKPSNMAKFVFIRKLFNFVCVFFPNLLICNLQELQGDERCTDCLLAFYFFSGDFTTASSKFNIIFAQKNLLFCLLSLIYQAHFKSVHMNRIMICVLRCYKLYSAREH